MFEYINYISDKNKLISKMENVKDMFAQIQEFDIDVTDAIDKIEITTNNVRNDTLSIVMVGAFSDGKTSVVAGWLNEKLENMKIDSDESSDEILAYKPSSLPDGCMIVDTPGLFGDKTGKDDRGEDIVLSEITKRYISEANVILYVVPAKNPIKDSHKSCIRWILNDLNKLSSTIFVINRMDDVVDLTDEEEFESQKRIKTENLRAKLKDCGISDQEAEVVKVVCVSAAPEGKGIEEWKAYKEEYLHRSRMTSLEEATNEVLKRSREMLITKTGCDVLNDELNKALLLISQQEHDIEDIILPEKKESLKRNNKDLELLKKRIRQSRTDIKDALKKLQKSKNLKIRSATMETFQGVMEEEIGIVPEKQGAILLDEISDILNNYLETYNDWTLDVRDRFQIEYEKQNKTVDNLLKKGAKGAVKGLQGVGKIEVSAIKQAIFAGRDLLGKIGIVIKFKPWQVAKMANFAAKAAPIAGAAIEIIANIVENVSKSEKNRKFEKRKDEVKNHINEVFAEYIEKITDDNWFFETFAPGIKVLEMQLEQDKNDIIQMEEMKNKYMVWMKKAKNIECDILLE